MKQLSIFLATMALLSPSAWAHASSQVQLHDCVIQEVLPSRHMTGAFLTFHNPGQAVDIVSAQIPSITPHVELHTMRMKDNVMEMVPLRDLTLPTGQRAFRKGGDHLMLMRIPHAKKPAIGSVHTIRIQLSDGTQSSCQAPVKSVADVTRSMKGKGGKGAKGHHHGHQHDHHHH